MGLIRTLRVSHTTGFPKKCVSNSTSLVSWNTADPPVDIGFKFGRSPPEKVSPFPVLPQHRHKSLGDSEGRGRE